MPALGHCEDLLKSWAAQTTISSILHARHVVNLHHVRTPRESQVAHHPPSSLNARILLEKAQTTDETEEGREKVRLSGTCVPATRTKKRLTLRYMPTGVGTCSPALTTPLTHVSISPVNANANAVRYMPTLRSTCQPFTTPALIQAPLWRCVRK